MAGEIGKLSAIVTANAQGLFTAFDAAERRLTRFASFTKSALGTLGIGLSFGSMGAAIKSAIDDAGRLVDVSSKLDIGVGALEQLELAARTSGVQAETLHNAIGKLQQKLGEAAAGSEEAQKDFERLGLSWVELVSVAPEESFAAVATKIGEMSDAYERAAAAASTMGKGGKELIPFLREFRGEVDAAGDSITKLSDAQAARLDSMGDSWERFVTRVKTGARGLGIALLEHMEDVSGLTQKMLPERMQAFGAAQAAGDVEKQLSLAKEIQRLEERGAKRGGIFGPIVEGKEVTWDEKIKSLTEELRASRAEAAQITDEFEQASLALAKINKELKQDLMERLTKGPVEALGVRGKGFARFGAAADARNRGLLTPFEAEEIGRKLWTELEKAGDKFKEKMFESTRTPLELFRAELLDINKLLTGETRQRALGNLITEAEKKLGFSMARPDVAAKERGSLEFGSAVNRFLNTSAGRFSPEQRAQEVRDALLKESKRQTEELKKLAEAWGVADVGQ